MIIEQYLDSVKQELIREVYDEEFLRSIDSENFLEVYRIFENGQIPLSNNSLEGEIRFTTLVRKNCLFAKSVRGAEANAIYYTLVATAKINKLNVYKYFKYLFDRLPNQKRSDIEAFLPWAEEVQQVCHN